MFFINSLCKVIAFFATCWLFMLCLYPLLVLMFIKTFFTKSFSNNHKENNEINVGIFHPYCNAGAGGERVLWSAVRGLQSKYTNVHFFIYTGDVDHDRETILANVEKVFDLKLKHDNINIVYLRRRKWVEAKRYKFCTLLGQTLGSMWLGWEALTLFKPDIFIDTMGYAFTYPIFKFIGGCKVASYTHYPIISEDMFNLVSQKSASYNNSRVIARSHLLRLLKLGYYRAIGFLYYLTGNCADIVMVNSTWTKNHINSLWRCPQRTHLLYPPCDVEKLVNLPILDEDTNEINIVSVGQFRPEKNHFLMIQVLAKLKSLLNAAVWDKIHLTFIGSCRNKDDESYVQKLKNFSQKLNVDEKLKFQINIPYNSLILELQRGIIGMHAMWNEHFGISIVDGLAAGLIMIANNSGGPKEDIIKENLNGYLAKDVDEYAKTIESILKMTPEERKLKRIAAKRSVGSFTTKLFEDNFVQILQPLFTTKNE